jgi:NADH:ubiquinone oxidoreductase subunit D
MDERLRRHQQGERGERIVLFGPAYPIDKGRFKVRVKSAGENVQHQKP